MHRLFSAKAGLAALLLASVAWGQPGWVASWGAPPQPPRGAIGPFPASPQFDNQTIRQVLRISTGGERLRLRLSNEYGVQPLRIGAARVGILQEDGTIRAGTERVVTFSGGARAATIPSGAPLLSDAVDLAVRDLERLSVSLYFPSATGTCTCHATGMQEAWVSGPGDFTAQAFEPVQSMDFRAFLSGVEVRAPGARTVVVLGDSISDGIGSTPNANRRWPDLLAERLNAGGDPQRWGVVNMGISGNRVLADGAGDSALARFDRDVLAVPGVSHLIVFEGVNDLGVAFGRFEGDFAAFREMLPAGPEVTVDSMIAGYRQLIARAHTRGLKVYGATIAPYGGAMYYSAQGEAVRQAINAWIRESREFDAVLDFDAVLRDPVRPELIRDGLHNGDFLHGSDAGYRAIAESIDLSLFE